MNSDTPDAAAPTSIPASPRKGSCLIIGFVVLLLLVATAVGAYYWINRPIKPVELSQEETQVLEEKVSRLEEPKYEKGSKEIILTEREINGLLNQNTNLGEKLKLTLGTDEIHARVETDLDQDLPVVGGKKLKARARFIVKTTEGRPSLVLDDLTVWGASLPNDWLAGMKGKDLLGEVFGNGTGLSGVEDIRIENGQLIIKLAE